MSLPIVVSISLSFSLVASIHFLLWRTKFGINLPLSLQVIVGSVATAFGIGWIVLPAFWFIVSYTRNPIGLEANLCPGTSIDNLIAALVAGLLCMLVYAIYALRRLLAK